METGERLRVATSIPDWNSECSAVGWDWQADKGENIILFNPLDFDGIARESETVISSDVPIRTAVWSPNGCYLAVGLEGGTVQLWYLKKQMKHESVV